MANQQQRDAGNSARDVRSDLLGHIDQVARQLSNVTEQPKDSASK